MKIEWTKASASLVLLSIFCHRCSSYGGMRSSLDQEVEEDRPPPPKNERGFVVVTPGDDPSRGQPPPKESTAAADRRRPSDEERLLRLLFGTYNQFARPVINSSNTVTVAIQFSLMHIKDLDIRSQILTTTGLLILEWTDERLTWNPEEHNGMSEIIIEAKALWKPEFAVINGAEKIYEEYDQFRAVVSHLGLVHWEPGGVFKTMCEIDITYYPFDEQRCQLTFGAWSYHTAKMNLTTSTATVNLDSYKKNGEWEILDTAAQRNEFSYECCPREKFSNVAFTVYLRRRHLFYVMNVIMPSIMTSVLLLSIFFCTPAQKVQIGVVVLLSFRIFLLNVAGNIPKTSDHIPLLVIYLTCTLAITTMSMVLTVFVLNLYGISDRPVPRWIRSMLLTCRTNRRRRRRSLSSQSLRHPSTTTAAAAAAAARESRPVAAPPPPSVLRSLFPACERRAGGGGGGDGGNRRRQGGQAPELASSASAVDDDDEAVAIVEMNRHHVIAAAADQSEIAEDVVTKGNDEVRATSSMATTTTAAVDDVTRSDADYAKDWKRVAEVFDRFFFWLFLFAVILSTVVLFHPLIKIGLSH